MVSFIVGRAGSGKTHRVISQIKEAQGEIILLVPEQYSYATERRLCSIAGDKVSQKAEVLSFKRIIDRIFMFAGGYANKPVDNGGRILLMQKAVNAVRPQLKVLSNMSLRTEFLQSLIDMVEEIKTCAINYEKLYDLGEEGLLSDKLRDIALIAAAYDGEFENGKLDPADRLQLAIERAKESGFFTNKKIWIDGYTGFSQQEIELLRVIFAQSEDCTITLCLNDDPEAENGAFAGAWETYSTLSRMAGECELVRLKESVRYENKALSHLEKNIFAAAQPLEEREGIELYEASNAYNECEIAAARILHLVRGGMRFRDIAVTARNFEEYDGILTSVFSRYGVPIYENAKQKVQSLAPTAFVLNALSVIADNFAYDDVIAYLKTGLTGIRRANLDVFEQYLYTWHIQRGEWTSNEDFTKNPSGRNTEIDEEEAEQLVFLNRLRKKMVTPLLSLRQNVKKDSTGAGYAKALYGFFGEVKLARRLEARSKLYRMRGDIYRAEQYESIWRILISAIENISETLQEVKFTPDEFIRMLSLVLSQYEIGTIPTALDRVNVGSFERLGEAPVKCVIILGAIDGRMPMHSAAKGILSDAEREKLAQMGIKLANNSEKRLNDEFKLIYNALTTASERLIVIVPHHGADGGEARESFVVSRIRNLFTNVKKEKFDMPELYAQSPCLDMAISGEEHPWKASARAYFSEEKGCADKFRIAQKNARVPRGPICDKENIDALFGKNIRLSASKTDSFNSCRYQYFLRYGLYLKPMRRATFDAMESGTFTHEILEYSLKEIKRMGGHRAVDIPQVYEIADRAIEKYVDEKLGGFKARSARFCAQFKRLKDSARKIVENVHLELRESSFEPVDFELHFSDRDGDLPALTIKGDDYTLKLDGFVDRVDACSMDDTLYIRVVDYKTGKKDFKLQDVLNGLNMQLFLYLFTLCDLGEERYSKKPEAAGVLYMPANEPLSKVSGTLTEEKAAQLRDAAVKRKGLLLNKEELYQNERFLPIRFKKDGSFDAKSSVVSSEEFLKISKRIREILCEMGSELSKGQIYANPYDQGNDRNTCTFCEMKGACHFDEIEGDTIRQLPTVRLEDF